jgi:hypothetical protein
MSARRGPHFSVALRVGARRGAPYVWGSMTVAPDLVAAVDSAFAVTGRGLSPWPDPHPEGMPADEEYSRLLDPAKWRIIGARAEAWMVALVDAGLAVLERNASIRWQKELLPVITRSDRLVPVVIGALPLVIARSRIDDIDDAGVVVGVGEPAICMAVLPFCGCDACDSGSQYELDELDRHILTVITPW